MRLTLAAVEAVAELTLATVRVRLRDDARVLASLGRPVTPIAATAAPEAGRVGAVVAAAARRLPWHPVCLPQAMAAQRMLRRRGLPQELHLSLRGGARPDAHAWVTSNGDKVVGSPDAGQVVLVTLGLPPHRIRSSRDTSRR